MHDIGRRWRRAGRWAAPAAIASILLLGALGVKSGEAQGNAAAAFQQMQAQISSLTALVRQQQATIARLSATNNADNQRLQRLRNAINAAAAAGEPTALKIRSNSTTRILDNLTTAFQAQAKQRPSGEAASSDESPLADLAGARLSGSVLRGAKLVKANLAGANLTGVELVNSSLQEADLRGAKLQGADLTGANLTGIQLAGALYDAKTRWPSGFDPTRHGALLVQ
jgi:uncharacterized protein YjbI with pentapeptide repeats